MVFKFNLFFIISRLRVQDCLLEDDFQKTKKESLRKPYLSVVMGGITFHERYCGKYIEKRRTHLPDNRDESL